MTNQEVRDFFIDKKDTPCELTKKLIRSGYQQTSGGYISYAKKLGVDVNYQDAEPNQWWHLIKSYCDNRSSDSVFPKSIQCGELIFWMAEVAECVDKEDLANLVDQIIASGWPTCSNNSKKPNVVYDRRKWNYQIQRLCFNSIIKAVESNKRIMK